VDDLARFIDNVRAELGQAVQLAPAVGQVFEKHCHVVIRIRARIAARSRAEQYDALDALSVERVKRGTKADQHRIVGRCDGHDAFSIRDAQPTTARVATPQFAKCPSATKKPGRDALSGFLRRERRAVRLLPLQLEDFVLDAEFLTLQIVDRLLVGEGTVDLLIDGAFEQSMLLSERLDAIVQRHAVSSC